MYEYTVCPSRHEEPKSISLMADRFGCRSRMFSGLRSQWMTETSRSVRKQSALRICLPNLRIRFNETPLNVVCRNRSYRL